MTTARQLIVRALGELQYFPEGESPSAGAVSDGLDALNALIASWHTESIIIAYPPATNWRGEWAERTVYAVNDSVSRSGNTYTCSTAHTASITDKPGVSQNGDTYWTLYAETPLTLSSSLPFPAPFERGVTSMLAVELGPMFGVDPSPLTLKKASDGKTALIAAYMQIQPVRVDNGLIRMPSQIWPYNIDLIT